MFKKYFLVNYLNCNIDISDLIFSFINTSKCALTKLLIIKIDIVFNFSHLLNK